MNTTPASIAQVRLDNVDGMIKDIENKKKGNDLFIAYKDADFLESSIFAYESTVLVKTNPKMPKELNSIYNQVDEFLTKEDDIVVRLENIKHQLEVDIKDLSTGYENLSRYVFEQSREIASELRDEVSSIKSKINETKSGVEITYEVIDSKILKLQNAVSSLISTYTEKLSEVDDRIYKK